MIVGPYQHGSLPAGACCRFTYIDLDGLLAAVLRDQPASAVEWEIGGHRLIQPIDYYQAAVAQYHFAVATRTSSIAGAVRCQSENILHQSSLSRNRHGHVQ